MRLVVAALVAVVAAGCGYHLQGATPLSPRMRLGYLDAPDRYSDFYQAMEQSWEASGGRLEAAATAASTILKVSRDQSGERVLSVSASNRPGEFEVYYTVEYSVVIAGKEVLPTQLLTLTRTYSYDEAAVLAKEHEQQNLRETLARELAGLVMRRLAAL